MMYNQSLLSYYFFCYIVSDFASGLLLSWSASIFFFLIWWGVIPYFLTKLSYFVFLLQPWNQALPLGAWFLLVVKWY